LLLTLADNEERAGRKCWSMSNHIGNKSSELRVSCIETAAKLNAATRMADSLLSQLLNILARLARIKKGRSEPRAG
jgi:hypothetical protein